MQTARIPKRVPVGTKYVIEGKSRGEGEVHIFSRYLLFPDGRCVDLPSDAPPPAQTARRRMSPRAHRR
jgi:hypothetical protein